MTTLDWARTQFAVTTLFHFIFVPMSIGLALFVAICQTQHYRTGDEVWMRMTRFWGKFLLISMAIGVVTGIVQEFQFGMNWSQYSRYVGDVFGAPLAMEGLLAFFLESTFLGLWIFGAGRLSARLHLVSVWLLSIGTMLSAYFILAANSWMQHPVGDTISRTTHRAHLTNIFAVLFQETTLFAFFHTILGAVTTGSMLVVAVSGWLLLRGRQSDVVSRSLRLALPVTLAAVLATMIVGDSFGRLLEKQQPMKMAAAEVVYHSERGAPFSLLSTGALEAHPNHVHTEVGVPHLLSLISTLSWNGHVQGMDNLQAADVKKYGPGNYLPIVGATYWSFRLMIGAGSLMLALALVGVVLMRRRRLESTRWFHRLALLGVLLPVLANWTGWIFTEVGRQPWVVFGLLKTSQANSPNVSTTDIVITLAGYIVIYGALIAVGGWLMVREMRHGPETAPSPEDPARSRQDRTRDTPDELSLAY